MQPVAGLKYTRFQAPGTTLVSQNPCVLEKVVVQAPLAGTITCFNCTGTAGTSSANQLLNLATATTQAAGAVTPVTLDMQFSTGLVVVALGTLDTLLGIR